MKSLTENQTKKCTSYLVKKIHNWDVKGEQLLVKVDCLVIPSYEQGIDYQAMVKNVLSLNSRKMIKGEFTYKTPTTTIEYLNNKNNEAVQFCYLSDDIILIFDFKIFEV